MSSHPRIGRRAVMLGVVGSGAALVGGCGTDGGPLTRESDLRGRRCVDRDTLTRHARIGQSALVYEVDATPSAFYFDDEFHGQLDAWLGTWAASHGRPDQVWTYGAFVDGQPECDSLHAAGRALDISQLRVDGEVTVSCRYDTWRDETPAVLAERERSYWRLAASLHGHFSYVLTYLYDDAHHNHIHVDNLVSQRARSVFNPRSRTQCQSVQAMCTHLWDRPLEFTGRWDDATRASVSEVLAGLGRSGTLTSRDNWVAFCDASAARA